MPYEDFFITTSYFIQDWARIASYTDHTDTDTAIADDSGTSENPVSVTTDRVAIVITKARDEDGNILEGLTYSVRYGLADCTDYCQVPSDVTESPLEDTDAETLTFSVPTPAAGVYYVTPVASTADGQRNGEETWFERVEF